MQIKDQLKEMLPLAKDTIYGMSFETTEILRLLPAFITEYEALQRKAEAGEKLANRLPNIPQTVFTPVGGISNIGYVPYMAILSALSAYKEATEPEEV